jgi:hypothetical protein
MSAHQPHPSPHADPLAQLDPFDFLMDAHVQLIRAIEVRAHAEPERVATALGLIVAHDRALAAIARAYTSGDRTFVTVAPPNGASATNSTLEDASRSRNALFEAVSTSAAALALEEELLLPWIGLDTWRGHLIGLAMLEGALAHALREGDPLPGA